MRLYVCMYVCIHVSIWIKPKLSHESTLCRSTRKQTYRFDLLERLFKTLHAVKARLLRGLIFCDIPVALGKVLAQTARFMHTGVVKCWNKSVRFVCMRPFKTMVHVYNDARKC